jgi:hypothetical protein
MDEDYVMLSPDGSEVKSLQACEGAWEFRWSENDPSGEGDYATDGPDDDWETVQLRTSRQGEYEDVWVDEGWDRWLERHLIPAGAEALSDAAVQLARRDYLAAAALDRASRLVGDLKECVEALSPDQAGNGNGPTHQLMRAAEALANDCAMQSAQLERAFRAALAEERGCGRGIAFDEEEDGACGQCEGTGRTQSASNMEDEACPVCDGSGQL